MTQKPEGWPVHGEAHSEKENRWNETAARVEKLRDKLGKSIDFGIKDAIVALNVLGINTFQSCEGHADRATGAPYIDIEAAEIPELNKKLNEIKNETEAGAVIAEIKRKNLEERRKIFAYLKEFYKTRHTSFEQRLTVQGMAREWSRLESQGTGLQKIEKDEVRLQKLQQYQEEMRAFTQFLKEKFFSS